MKPTLLLIPLLLSGCATLMDGTWQDVTVKTAVGSKEVAGAKCSLKNEKGTWMVVTPGTVRVHRNFEELRISCELAEHERAEKLEAPTMKPSFPLTGLIGFIFDMATGAAYEYHKIIWVSLEPKKIAPEK